MALSPDIAKAAARRLLLSRMRLLESHGFFGLLLMHMTFTLDESLSTAATDGERLYWNPDFLDSLSDSEVDFVMMHEILHAVLLHCSRGAEYDPYLFNVAADIVVNSNILKSKNMDLAAITLKKWGESMHKTPKRDEGYLYTAEEVYHMLLDEEKKCARQQSKAGNGGGDRGKNGGASAEGGEEQKNGNGKGQGNSAQNEKGNSAQSGKNASKSAGRPQGGESGSASSLGTEGGKSRGGALGAGWDDHSRWKAEDGELEDAWLSRMEGAIAVLEASQNCGSLPGFAERILKERRHPTVHWRELLDRFVKEEVTDYTFSPPDRRYDGDFFLPDFNDRDEDVGRILFMVDTSGSISDRMLTDAYGEILGAVEEFGGKLEGYLGFFDAKVYPPVPFTDQKELLKIRPKGGGGTSFTVIFDYLKGLPPEEKPKSLVILTDGYAPYPEERAAEGIPVLWLMSTAVTPPFGKVARMDPKKK